MIWDGIGWVMGREGGITAKMTTINRLAFNKPRDVLPDKWDALAVRVSSDGANLALELLGTSDDIFRERVSCQLSESWPFHQCRNLCKKTK
jgi:hypothetical protein